MVEWIKPGLNIDWVGQKKMFFTISVLMIVASIAVMTVNFFVRGEPVNYGTDFKGGSEIQVEFAKPVDAAQVRAALTKGGFRDAVVVKVNDGKRPHFFMLRVADVTAFNPEEQARVKAELDKRFKGNLLGMDYKQGSDKVYIRFKRGFKLPESEPSLDKQIEAAYAAGKVEAQQVQRFGKPEDNVFEVGLAGLDRDIRKIFDTALGAGFVKDVPQVEAVGAKMGKQLRDAGFKSVIYSLLLILLYVALRFDFRYAPGGVVALFHDIIITTGVIALTWKEFSMTAVAALLTLAGYSINDTIVVYDRIRENTVKYRDRKFNQIVNASINETLARTIITSLTTFFTSAAMWILGAGDVAIFAFIFSFGILIGTYSSIAIASPFTVWLNEKFQKTQRASAAKG
jgi:preprotein translocase subunit SecF